MSGTTNGYARSFTPDEPATEPSAPRALPRDLWKACDALLNPRTIRLARREPDWLTDIETSAWGVCSVPLYRARMALATREKVTLPSLFDQLAAAVQSGQGAQAHGIQESKPPCDAAALALLIDIAEHARSGCWNWRIKRTRDTPTDLKAIVKAVNAYNDPDLIDIATQRFRSWAAQIKATISSEADRTWRMHGAACRVCSATSVPVWLDDGTETRQPALIVHSEEGTIRHIECGFCGSILTGDDLTQIIRDRHDTTEALKGKMTA